MLYLRDGGTIVITDVTEEAHHLARAVTAAVPGAAPTQADWDGGARIGVYAAVLILAAMATVFALVFGVALPYVIALVVFDLALAVGGYLWWRRARRQRQRITGPPGPTAG